MGIKWIIVRSRFSKHKGLSQTDEKPCSTSFGQIPSKTNDVFSKFYLIPLNSLIPLNPRYPITFKNQFSSILIHLTILGIVYIHT